MNELDELAERNAEFEGYRLVDYGPVALPYYVLYVNAVVVLRRPLPPVTEYLFRSIRHGLVTHKDISGFLGVGINYVQRLAATLRDERCIVELADGTLSLGARAEDALSTLHDESPEEREIQFLWDLIQARPSGYIETLKRNADVERDGEEVVRAYPMRAPTIAEIPIHLVQDATRRQERARGVHGEVIRLRNIARRVLRYRPAAVLIYAPKRGNDLRVKFAVDGKIDDEISLAFAGQNGPQRMGLVSEFTSKSAIAVVRQRLKDISGGTQEKENYAKLISRRAVLRWSIKGVQIRMDEDKAPALSETLAEKTAELEVVEAQLKKIAIREILPFEIPMLVQEALRAANNRLTITTTRPSVRRMDARLIEGIREAVDRKVHITILIAESKSSVDESGNYGVRDPVLELGRLAGRYGNLQVGFLADSRRLLYEILCDEEFLVVSNDSPLGARPRKKSFAPFAGVLLSSKADIRSYVAIHMQAKDISIAASPLALRSKRRIHRKKGENRKNK